VARWLAGVSLIVLLIACANVTNLLLARAARRRREIAVRLAIGISRWRLVRLLVAESVILAAVGCVGGLLLAYWGGAIIRTLLLPGVAWTSGPVNARVLGVAAALTVAAGVLVGLLPALQSRHLDLTNSLKAGSHLAGGQRTRLRSALLFAQCSLSMVLLVGAGLFVKSLANVRNLDLGYHPDRVLSTDMTWPPIQIGPPGERASWQRWQAELARRSAFLERAVDRLHLTPAVQHAAIAVGTPFGNMFGVTLSVPGYDSIPNLGDGPYISAVTHGYFEATGMRLLQGRVFSANDRAGTERVTIVNETMAKTLWPNQNPLDKCLQIFSGEVACARVVGVVADVRRHALREPPAMQYYVPYGQEMGIGGSVLLVRPVGHPRDFVPALHRVLREMEPNLGLIRTKVMQEAIDPLVRPWRVGAILFGVFAALALIVAAIGLYSVIAYSVSQRTQEFGVRLALGATTGRILSLVLVGGVAVTVAGLAAGAVLAVVAGRFIGPLLFETSPRDPAVFAAAMFVLFAVAIVACLVPASRATRVDPVIALRAD
jgi:predicted permease